MYSYYFKLEHSNTVYIISSFEDCMKIILSFYFDFSFFPNVMTGNI